MDKRICAIALSVMALLPLFFSIANARGLSGSNSAAVEQKIMTTPQAIVLGVVEGVTEYLPVSSTGHLLLAEKILGISRNPYLSAAQRLQVKDALDAYTICIQVGAILAVLWLYFGRLKQMVQGISDNDADGRRLLINVAAGFLPAAVIGLLFNHAIKTYLFGPWPVVAAWLVGGIAILAVSRPNRRKNQEKRFCIPVDDMTWKMALVIGFAQCIAMWPGVSRSLVTIMGGLLVGLTMEAAVEYSFLLGVVTLGAATAYDVLKHGRMMLQIFDHYSLIVGVTVAFFAALVSVKWMVRYLSRHGLEVFGYYRVGIAVVTTVFLLTAEKIWIQ
jgi:undecaprenyl-diphosphatase